jgi:hypothetical protein
MSEIRNVCFSLFVVFSFCSWFSLIFSVRGCSLLLGMFMLWIDLFLFQSSLYPLRWWSVAHMVALTSMGNKVSGLSLLRHRLLSVLDLWLFRLFCSKELYACCSVQGVVGKWIIFMYWRLIHSPVSNLFGSSLILIFHIFL